MSSFDFCTSLLKYNLLLWLHQMPTICTTQTNCLLKFIMHLEEQVLFLWLGTTPQLIIISDKSHTPSNRRNNTKKLKQKTFTRNSNCRRLNRITNLNTKVTSIWANRIDFCNRSCTIISREIKCWEKIFLELMITSNKLTNFLRKMGSMERTIQTKIITLANHNHTHIVLIIIKVLQSIGNLMISSI